MFRKFVLSLAFLLAAFGAVFSAQAAVYRPGLHVARFSLNKKQVAPDLNYDLSTSSFSDYALQLVGDATVSKDRSVSNPITGKAHKWGEYYVYAYTGEIYLDASKTYVIGGGFDDGSAIVIDQGTEDEFVWSQGGTSGATQDGWVAPTNYKPTVTGWHPVKLFLWNWSNGVKHSAPYGLTYNTEGVVDYSVTDSWSSFADDGGMTLFRTPIAETYVRADYFVVQNERCDISVTSLSPCPATITLYREVSDGEDVLLGTANLAAGGTHMFTFAWTEDGMPACYFKVDGTDPAFKTNGDFHEVSPVLVYNDMLRLSASIQSVGVASATLACNVSYMYDVAGMTHPDVECFIACGSADAGEDADAWGDGFKKVEDISSPGAYVVSVGHLPDALSYARIAVRPVGAEALVWSEPFQLFNGAVSVSAPASVYENGQHANQIVISRSGSAVGVDQEIALEYTGSVDSFSALPASVTIPAKETSVAINLMTVDNADKDGDRTVTVTIGSGDYPLGDKTSAVVKVIDDELLTARNCVWTGGAADGLWESEGNWEDGIVPLILDTVSFGSSLTAGDTITVSSDVYVDRLVIDTDVSFAIVGPGSIDLKGIERCETADECTQIISVPLRFSADDSGFASVDVAPQGSPALQLGDFVANCPVKCTGSGILQLLATSGIDADLDFGTSTGRFAAASGKTAVLSGSVAGTGGLIIGLETGANGTVQLSSTNNVYTGDSRVYGTITLKSEYFFPNGSDGKSRDGDVYLYGKFSMNSTIVHMNGLHGTGTVTCAGSGNSDFYVGENGADGNYTGEFVNNPGGANLHFYKKGGGIQRFSEAIGWKYSLQLSEGELQIDGSLSVNRKDSVITVSSGGTLSGAGSIHANSSIKLNAGGILKVGSELAGGQEQAMTLKQKMVCENGARMAFYEDRDRSTRLVSDYAITGADATVSVSVSGTKGGKWKIIEAETLEPSFELEEGVRGKLYRVGKESSESGKDELWYERTTGLAVIIR